MACNPLLENVADTTKLVVSVVGIETMMSSWQEESQHRLFAICRKNYTPGRDERPDPGASSDLEATVVHHNYVQLGNVKNNS
jgi:hypothetical protein